jgi:prepilin-type N-terminal cleavage/methylation domain-containing protein
MTLNNIKTIKKDKGFTLVELLIVIVVIAILAAITIVAYNGIQTRANASTAKSNAESVQKVAEAFSADDTAGAGNGTYAASAAALTAWSGGVARVPSGVSVVGTTLTSTNKDGKTIQYTAKGTTGACIGYWDASLATPAAVYVYAGNATTGTNAATPTCT